MKSSLLLALSLLFAANAVAQAVAPPLISRHPQNTRVFVGESVTFSVEANPTGPVSFQWYHNGQPLGAGDVQNSLGVTGGDTRTLRIAAASERHLGLYHVRVSDSVYPRGIDSLAASLTVEPARFINISTRAFVGPGGLAVGFVIRGQPKRILIRAIGPSLATFGVSDALPNPEIQLVSGGRVVATNDDWRLVDAGAFANAGAFPLSSGSRDAALVGTFNIDGAYTVEVKASESPSTAALEKTGTVLVEVYELP